MKIWAADFGGAAPAAIPCGTQRFISFGFNSLIGSA